MHLMVFHLFVTYFFFLYKKVVVHYVKCVYVCILGIV
jgi:hypothetical protein